MGEDLLISQGFNEYSHYEVILLRRLTTPALRHVADTLFILALVIGLALAARPLYASSALPIPSALPASEPGGQVPGYTIVVDPGHGGKDGGAIGARTGIPEAGLNLTVSQLVQAGLEAAGYQVILTRGDADALGPDKQSDMAARKAIMNQPGVDLVVSIHMNKFSDPSVSGPMAFYMQGSQPGEALATQVIQALCTALDRPLRKANRLSAVVSALGASIFFQNAVMLIYGARFYVYPDYLRPDFTVSLFGMAVPGVRLMVIAASVLLMLALWAFIQRTRTGAAIRAVAIDQGAARLMGINVNRVISLVFFIGPGLGGAAGLMVGIYYGQIDFTMGWSYGLKAFTAAILGGIGNIPGAMLGGLLLGVIEALAAGYIAIAWKDAIAFLVLILILIIRPTGILGERTADKL